MRKSRRRFKKNCTKNEPLRKPLGLAPGILAKRKNIRRYIWCPEKPDIEFDSQCDPDNPKTITYKKIVKAASAIKKEIPATPLVEAHWRNKRNTKFYFKAESLHRTGSFHERGALYSLIKLSDVQRQAGVFTASLGNWALALSYYGQKLGVPVTVVLPKGTSKIILEKCFEYGAEICQQGHDFATAKRFAFTAFSNSNMTYINGYDHPHVIAASGTIGLEILEENPDVDAILVPVGGGGLIAGIAAAAKYIKPEILIYGVQPKICCSFYKSMEKREPYGTDGTNVTKAIAGSLALSKVGINALHTARPLIDRMVLIEEDWIAQSMVYLIEEQKLVTEGAGAVSLSPHMAFPDLIPELRDKTVVCVVSGGNTDCPNLFLCLERAHIVEGRLIKLRVTLPADEQNKTQLKVLSIISNVGCNILDYEVEHGWLEQNDWDIIYLTLACQAYDIKHACSLKRVMERLFPNMCEFNEEPFFPVPTCFCFPKRIY